MRIDRETGQPLYLPDGFFTTVLLLTGALSDGGLALGKEFKDLVRQNQGEGTLWQGAQRVIKSPPKTHLKILGKGLAGGVRGSLMGLLTGYTIDQIRHKARQNFARKLKTHPYTLAEKRELDEGILDKRGSVKQNEFAPGIPRKQTTHAIPKIQNKHWTIAIQEHNAKKAGKHLDLRLVDPRTSYAHSWAIPKARFPAREDRPLLAIQTPTHTSEYALHFGENNPKTIGKGYGTGTVKIVEKAPVKILTAKPSSIKFEKDTGETYHLFRTKDTTWLLQNTTPGTKKAADMSEAYGIGYKLTLEKLAARSQMGMEGAPRTSEMRQPIDSKDKGSPANSLAMMLQEIPELQTKNQSKSTDLGIERRLNRHTGWSGPHSMQGERIEGGSPIMVGRW